MSDLCIKINRRGLHDLENELSHFPSNRKCLLSLARL